MRLLALDEATVTELLKQVPALAVLVYLVVFFLKALDKRDARAQAMGKECHDAQHEANATQIERNEATMKLIGAVDRINDTLDGLRPMIADAVRDGLRDEA